MNNEFEKRFESLWPQAAWQDLRVLVAVSGGADSVALLRALMANSSHPPDGLVVAHFNHHWRGVESDRDAQFVAKLAEELCVTCEQGESDVDLRQNEPSREHRQTEDAARQQRYSFLQRVAEQHGARYVATAHTADDQAETVLHRIVRGTGIGGLAGIPRLRVLSPAVTLMRPMLGFRRQEIEAYLREIGQDYCEDSSNCDTTYTRNRIRRELIPDLTANYNPKLTDAILRLADLAGEHQKFLADHVRELNDQCVVKETDVHIVIDVGKLVDRQPLLIREFFVSLWKRKRWPRQSMGFAEWTTLQNLATKSERAKIILPGSISCCQEDGQLTVRTTA